MSAANRYKPHLVMIPEDDANRQMAIGFINHHAVDDQRSYVVTPSGGWTHVLSDFQTAYIPYLHKWPNAYVVLLIDFDDRDNRREECEATIPDDLKPRVFVIGSKQYPEVARADIGESLERIGTQLADECCSGQYLIWTSDHFDHNTTERIRLAEAVHHFLFHS